MTLLPRLTLRKYWPWLGLLIGIGFSTVFGIHARGIERLENDYFDYLESTREPLVRDDPAKDPITLVGIDDATYDSTSTDPREIYAGAIENILKAKPRVLGIDLQFEGRDRALDGVDAALDDVRKDAPSIPSGHLDAIKTKLDVDKRIADALRGQPTVLVFFSTVEPGAHDDFTTLPAGWRSRSSHCENLPQLHDFNRLEVPYEQFAGAAGLGGNAFLPPDADGIVREYPLVTRLGRCSDCIYPSLAEAIAKAYFYVGDWGEFDAAKVRDEADNIDCGASLPVIVDLQIETYDDQPNDSVGNLRIDFRKGFNDTFPNWLRISDVAAGKVAPERFRDKAVILGTKSDYSDHFATPTDPLFPGFGIHALVAHSLLTHTFLRRSAKFGVYEALGMLLCGLAVTLLFLVGDPGGWPLIGVILLPVAGHMISLGFLTGRVLGFHVSHGGDLVDALIPGLAGALALLACTGARFVVEREARQQSERELGRFLSPSVVDIALKKPELLLPARKEITILFSDIRGFTTTAEGMTPEALVSLLDQYLTKMTDIVFEHRGTLDKYIGDAVMALYGAPLEYEDHPAMACRSALEMFRVLAKLQEQWKAEGRPVLKIGVGINTGVVSVGRMGSSAKSEYTCIGDEVNFASRVEGLTKAYGVHILVGENTRERVGDDLVFRDIGPVRVKGKKKSVRVYELVGTRADIPDTRWIATFEQAMERFRARDWDATDELLKKAIAERGGEDAPSQAVMQWTRIFRQHPPEEDWDGTIERREK